MRLAFLEWYRKSELSSDRAGLLGSQDLAATMRLFMKMAGGGNTAIVRPGDLNLEPFLQQANEYASSNDGLDLVYKIVNTLALTHPMHVVRAAEVQRWVQAGDYDRIINGEYVRRGTETGERPLRDDMREAASHYKAEFTDAADHLKNAARRAAERAKEAFRDARAGSGSS